jgi:hypothetical protein
VTILLSYAIFLTLVSSSVPATSNTQNKLHTYYYMKRGLTSSFIMI